MKQITTFLLVLFLLFFAKPAYAQDTYNYTSPCESVGQCVGNRTCVVDSMTKNADGTMTIAVSQSETPNCNSSSIGGVQPPGGVRKFDIAARIQNGSGDQQNIGLIIFISNLLKVFAIVAGIWAMFNLIMGGYTYITSMSDAGATEKVRTSITMTIIGIAIIAGAYIIAAVIGALMFGDPNFILQPQLQGAV